MDELFARLSAPFPPDRVEWRVGAMNREKTKGMALAYIDARDVADRLDEACGPQNWQNRYPHANGKTVCEIGIRIGDDWVWKADGAGDTDVEAEKGALSDAFKRAAVRWGVGRYLYDIPSPWVAVNQYKQIEDSEKSKLQGILARHAKGRSAPATSTAAAPEPESGALIMARDLLTSARSKDEFTEIWNANKGGWKGVMSDADYKAIVRVMHAEAERWAAAKAPAGDFGDVSTAGAHLSGRAAA